MAIEPRHDLIDLYLQLKMPQPAEKYIKELIKIDLINKGFNFYKLAYVYHQIKNYDESIRYLDMALNEGYNTIGVHRLLCASLLDLKKYQEQKRLLKKL